MTKIYTYKINKDNKEYTINVNLSEHANYRLVERKIRATNNEIGKNFQKIGSDLLNRINQNMAVIDTKNNFSIIVKIKRYKKTRTLNVDIITVLNKTEIFTIGNTEIIRN